jgi:ferric-dicitrate binding protein FerR (iron transport regulator)
MTARERIHELIDKYAANTATVAEQDELAHLLDLSEGNEEAISYLRRLLQQTTPLPEHSEARWQAIRAAIGQTVPATRAGKLSMVFRWTAAAAIIAGITTWYLFLPKPTLKTQPASTAVRHDRPPGGNVAMLTLSDGSIIALDSARTGPLTQQGNTKIAKLNNGQLAYQEASSYKLRATSELLYNTLTTPRGGQYRLLLPDGTGVWLNAASSITYPTAFAGDERVVRITGEVYFEVQKDPTHPFKVIFNPGADSGSVEVLGTHFNINAYSDEATVKTTLLEGSVRVVSKAATLLKPGQQAQLDNTGHAAVFADVDLDEVIAWKNGRFHFEDADIRTVMRQIARWYDVEVAFEGKITTEKFVGDIPRNSRLTEVFKILELSNVHFKVEDKKVTVIP